MTEKAESTHQRILGRGLEVVSERGLAGVSLVASSRPGRAQDRDTAGRAAEPPGVERP
jgi:hypothetical protein